MPEENMNMNYITINSFLCVIFLCFSCNSASESRFDQDLLPLNEGNMWKLVLEKDTIDETGCIFKILNTTEIDSIDIPPEYKNTVINSPYKLLFGYFHDDVEPVAQQYRDYVFKTNEGFGIYVIILGTFYYFKYPIGEFKDYTYSYSPGRSLPIKTVNCTVSFDEIYFNQSKYKTYNYKFDERTVFSFSIGLGFSRYIENDDNDLFRNTYVLDSLVIL
jgi:hypothetical protein